MPTMVVIRCSSCEEHGLTPCTTGCKEFEGAKCLHGTCEFAEDFVNRHPSVGSTLAATYTSDEGIDPSSCSSDNHIVETSAQIAHKHDLVLS